MPRTAPHSHRRTRTRTSCSAIALATVLVVGSSPAQAQSFLGTGTYVTNPAAGGITTAPSTTTVNLNPGQTVIDWTPLDTATSSNPIGFQLPGTTATFTGTSDFAVLNRINPADLSRAISLDGTVNSLVNGAQGGSVYFYAQGGFVLGANSAFNVGSLVLSALPITVNGSGQFIASTGSNRTVTFGQSLQPSAAISTHANTQISANNGYVAMIAPRVVHGGSINVNGSAVLVAAEAAIINFSPDGLFDIQVTVGTTDSQGLNVQGDITGPAPAAVEKRGVYLVAVPKNDALTMVIGNGVDLGFTLANTAIDDNGVVVLSAGYDITDGAIGAKSAAPGTGAANFWFNGAHATNNLFGRATGTANLVSDGAQPPAVFDNDVTLHAASIAAGDIQAGQDITLLSPGTITTGDIDAGGIFMALGHGDMSFGDATASEVFLADYSMMAPAGGGGGGGGGGIDGTCVGACGTSGANGVVTAPPSGSTYSYVTTEGGVSGAGQIPGEGGTNGSLFTTVDFSAAAGDDLNFWFNFVTSDGSGFADYAWAALYTASLDPVAILFTARTQPSGTIVPGQNLPGVEATLNPSSVPIIPGGPTWSPLGSSSGSCYSAGCGYTGWINSTYDIANAGNYVVRFGVSNWSDTAYQTGMAFSGITIAGVPVQPGLTRTGGAISIGNVDTGKFTAAAGTTLTTGIIHSGTSIDAQAGGAISTGNLFAGSFVLAEGESITTGNVDAGSIDMTSTGGGISTQALLADGDIELDASGNISFASANAGGEFDFSAGGSVTGGAVVAGNQIGGNAGSSVTLGNLTAGLSDEDDFSVGIGAIGNVTVGNATGPGAVGFATQGNLETGNLSGGGLVMALVGGNTSINGSITTTGEDGGQVYMADDSMFATGGGTFDGEGDFNPDTVLALDPVATGGSIAINGPVNTGLFEAAAGTNLVTQAITANGGIHARAGGTAALNGVWTSSAEVNLSSNDIDITPTGGIEGGTTGEIALFSTNPTQMLIGDGLSGTGYALSNAEFGRISGADVTILGRGDASAAIDMLIGDLAVTGPSAGSTIESSDGVLAFGVGDIDGESVSGVIRVAGDVNATGFGPNNAIEFYATRFDLDASTGSVSIFSSGSTLSGEIGLYADRIHVAEGSILDQLAANPTYSGYQEDLNDPAAVQRPEGVLRTATLWIESDNLQDILIQNTGTAATPAGFLFNESFINDDDEVAGPPASINLVVNGQVQTEGGTLTGVEARDALVEGADISPFTSNSTINGCPLSGSCGANPQPTTVIGDQIAIINDDPLGDSEFGNEDSIDDNEEGDEGVNNPISPPQPLFDTRPLIPASDVNDPVSGTGNPSLMGSDCDEEDEAQCVTEKEDGE